MGGGDFWPAKTPPDTITPRPTYPRFEMTEESGVDYGLTVVVVEPWTPILFFRRAVDVR
jgi:hypothetical protein